MAADMEAAGVKTATGNTVWHKNSVRTMIGNVVYKGTIHNGHEHHFPHLAIVTPAEWAAAQPSEGKGNRDHAPRGAWAVLGGLVRCDGCGHVMSPSAQTKDGRTYRYYKCQTRSCTAKALVDATKLDAFVSASALAVFTAACEQGIIASARTRTSRRSPRWSRTSRTPRDGGALRRSRSTPTTPTTWRRWSSSRPRWRPPRPRSPRRRASPPWRSPRSSGGRTGTPGTSRPVARSSAPSSRAYGHPRCQDHRPVEEVAADSEDSLATGLPDGVPFELAYSGAKGIKIDYLGLDYQLGARP